MLGRLFSFAGVLRVTVKAWSACFRSPHLSDFLVLLSQIYSREIQFRSGTSEFFSHTRHASADNCLRNSSLYTSVLYSLPTISKHTKGKRKTSRKAVTAPPTGVSKVHSTGYYTDFLKTTSGPSVMEKKKTTTSLSKKPTNSSTKDDDRNIWEKQEEFERVLETLTVSTRGEDGKLVKGDIRQYYHCRINKKPRKDMRVQGQHRNEYFSVSVFEE